MRMWRLPLLLLVALGLAPGTWVRPQLPAPDFRSPLSVERLALPHADLGALTFTGAWRLQSPNSHFGGYSALVVLDDDTALAASDRGRMLHVTLPGRGPIAFAFDYFGGQREDAKNQADIEALTRDPANGRLWAAYESTNQIERHDAGFHTVARVEPEAMEDWPGNAGPEAMVRLHDGRFIVLAEASPDWLATDNPALLFSGDPVEGAEPLAFRFAPPPGYRPVDMAELPDGRVLILLRDVHVGLPPRFVTRLIVADPAEIGADVPWRGKTVADITAPVPSENYEGMAIDSRGDTPVIWLISDDNTMRYQRTLLLRLEWRGYAKARGFPRAPR